MEERAYLTAVSDAVLSIASIWSVIMMEGKYRDSPAIELSSSIKVTSASLGFSCLAMASFLGFIRFSVLLPQIQDRVIRVHMYSAFLGSALGLPHLAAAYCLQTKYQFLHHVFIYLSIAGPLLEVLGFFKRAVVSEIASTISIITIIVISVLFAEKGMNRNGLIGALCFIIGGLVIGTQGKGFLGLKNVDWFHYVLALGTVFLAAGISQF